MENYIFDLFRRCENVYDTDILTWILLFLPIIIFSILFIPYVSYLRPNI